MFHMNINKEIETKVIEKLFEEGWNVEIKRSDDYKNIPSFSPKYMILKLSHKEINKRLGKETLLHYLNSIITKTEDNIENNNDNKQTFSYHFSIPIYITSDGKYRIEVN